MNEWEKFFKQAKEKLIAAKALLEGDEPDMKQVKTLQADAAQLQERAEAMKAVAGSLATISEPQLPAALPTEPEPTPTAAPTQAEHDAEVAKAVTILRYGITDDPTSLVMREIYGDDYRQKFWNQEQGLKAYMRDPRAQVGRDQRQMWSATDVVDMLKTGLSVQEIKATMVEGTDILGGFAVPPHVMSGIIARMKGLTAVRDGGALVIQSASNMIKWMRLTGGGSQYPTSMRGLWGTETQTPTQDDFNIGELDIPVNVYTYKVHMSVSLLEDATNLVQVFTSLVSDTMAIDEDTALLTGDGAGKPRGLLPGTAGSGANADSLTEVTSGSASALTMDGLKLLKRGIKSQYRAAGRATLIGNSDTGADIETMVDGMGRYFIDDLNVGEKFLGATWRESESMPDVTAGYFPLIYGDMSGYAIAERLGMAIQRYNDSNTGINLVQFHIRRRVGGRVIEPWKFAVQEVAAS